MLVMEVIHSRSVRKVYHLFLREMWRQRLFTRTPPEKLCDMALAIIFQNMLKQPYRSRSVAARAMPVLNGDPELPA